MKTAVFHPAATLETAEAVAFYNEQQNHLGKRFLCAVEDATLRVTVDPLLYPVVEGDVRRCLVNNFPFSILFRIVKRRIIIVAVMHQHRQPGYWKGRVQ